MIIKTITVRQTFFVGKQCINVINIKDVPKLILLYSVNRGGRFASMGIYHSCSIWLIWTATSAEEYIAYSNEVKRFQVQASLNQCNWKALNTEFNDSWFAVIPKIWMASNNFIHSHHLANCNSFQRKMYN